MNHHNAARYSHQGSRWQTPVLLRENLDPGHLAVGEPEPAGPVTVAGKPSADVPPGTLAIALRQTGVKK